jgi:hypothetical protein
MFRRHERHEHALAMAVGFAVHALYASLPKERLFDRAGDGAFSFESFGVVKDSPRIFAPHADRFLEQQTRLQNIGVVTVAPSLDKLVSVKKQ